MLEFKKHTWVEVDLDALKHNIESVRGFLQDTQIIAVVKADAYGHGAIATCNYLKSIGIDFFAVSSLREAVELRKSGIDSKILILGYTSPDQAEVLADYSISQTVHSPQYAATLSGKLKAFSKKLNIHIKLNTGMNRIGFNCCSNDATPQIIEVLQNDCFAFEGLFTHFAAADRSGDPDLEFTKLQASRFNTTYRALKASGYIPKIRHCCNSAGIFTIPEMHLDAVRLGIAMYGLTPDQHLDLPIKLQPVMSLKSVVTMLHEASEGDTVSYGRTYKSKGRIKLATIAVGYADGYPRFMSNHGQVLINGSRCSIVGRVCMDQIVVDVTHLENVREGDEAILIGTDKSETITAQEIADFGDTINYEIVCSVSRRVPRYYYLGGKNIAIRDYLTDWEN